MLFRSLTYKMSGRYDLNLDSLEDMMVELNSNEFVLKPSKILVPATMMAEALKIADYLYVIGDGVLAGEGTREEMAASKDPFLRQFFDALPDGPIQFHYPSAPYQADLRLQQ